MIFDRGGAIQNQRAQIQILLASKKRWGIPPWPPYYPPAFNVIGCKVVRFQSSLPLTRLPHRTETSLDTNMSLLCKVASAPS